jgi:hypothetical protein
MLLFELPAGQTYLMGQATFVSEVVLPSQM